jgi:hypothetical protein
MKTVFLPGEKQASVVVRLQGVSNLIRASLQLFLDAFTADVENASPRLRLRYEQFTAAQVSKRISATGG